MRYSPIILNHFESPLFFFLLWFVRRTYPSFSISLFVVILQLLWKGNIEFNPNFSVISRLFLVYGTRGSKHLCSTLRWVAQRREKVSTATAYSKFRWDQDKMSRWAGGIGVGPQDNTLTLERSDSGHTSGKFPFCVACLLPVFLDGVVSHCMGGNFFFAEEYKKIGLDQSHLCTYFTYVCLELRY